MGILIIFLIFIYGLKLKVKMLRKTLTLDEGVEIVLLSGRQAWFVPLKSEIYLSLGRELQTVVLLSITICLEKSAKMIKAAEKMRRVSG
jgi:hypothetical protein